MQENGRKGASEPPPDHARQGAGNSLQLTNETSRLMESLQYRLLRLRAIGGTETEAIAIECERALAEIRKELDAIAAERPAENEGS